jgi:hypothetical protein
VFYSSLKIIYFRIVPITFQGAVIVRRTIDMIRNKTGATTVSDPENCKVYYVNHPLAN